jgi:hypothetical protein
MKTSHWGRASMALAAALACPAFAAGEATQLAVASYPAPSSAWLSWASDAPAGSSFRIERRAAGSRAWYALATLPASARSFADGGLRLDESDEHRLVTLACGAALVSPQTALLATPSAASTQAGYDDAAAPRRVDAQAVSPTEVIVTWADQTPDETHFRIERRQAGGSWSAIGTAAADATLYKDAGLSPGATYEYRVSAERAGLPSATSAARLAPTPPTGSGNWLRYVDGSACNTGSNAGTINNPWKTIQLAAWSLAAGQTVLVRNRADCATPTVYKTTANATTGKHAFAVVDISNDVNAGQFATGGARSGRADAWITYRNYADTSAYGLWKLNQRPRPGHGAVDHGCRRLPGQCRAGAGHAVLDADADERRARRHHPAGRRSRAALQDRRADGAGDGGSPSGD